MVLKAAVQALRKADVLKAQAAQISLCDIVKGNCSNALLNDSSTWNTRQQLTSALHQVLVLDLDYALDQKVEQELWTLGFKNYIAALQALSRDKKNAKRSESQALLSWCLESASGFYLTLLQELCEAFQLDLPFRRRGIAYGSLMGRVPDQPAIPPQRSSCLYICQYCLVHLGDIARYRNQRKQAESFYRHAILLSPSSGQPYNQLALLQTSRGDRLSTVFYYVRSVALAHPFPPASSNLSKTLEVASNETLFTEPRMKMTVSEYTSAFLKLHGLLHSGLNLNQAEILVKSLISTLTALTATGSFSSRRLTEMLVINLHALTEATDNFDENQLTNDEKRIRDMISDLIAGFFNACLLPVYTLQASNILEYHSLPAIKLTLEYIKLDPKFLENNVFSTRLQIWPSLCQLLNTIQPMIQDFSEKDYVNVPLPEDTDLQGFLPLDKAFAKLDFSVDNSAKQDTVLNQLRAARIVKLGLWLCSHKVFDEYLTKYSSSDGEKEYVFEAVSKQVEPMSDLLKQLEQLKFDAVTEEVSSSSKENSQDDELRSVSQISTDIQIKDKQQKVRTGILKPQGSLERAREERAQAMLLNSNVDKFELNPISASSMNTYVGPTPEHSNELTTGANVSKLAKKGRQNVAMQAILKKVEENSKQVKFETDEIKLTELNEKEQKVTVKEFNEVTNKKGPAGILSLKNQSGYPHLVDVEKPRSDFLIQSNEQRKQSHPDMKVSLPEKMVQKFSETKTESPFPVIQPSNFPLPTNVNFPTLPFAQNVSNTSQNQAEFLNANMYNTSAGNPPTPALSLNYLMPHQSPIINQNFKYANQQPKFNPTAQPMNQPFGRPNQGNLKTPQGFDNNAVGLNNSYPFPTQFQSASTFGPNIYNNSGPIQYGANPNSDLKHPLSTNHLNSVGPPPPPPSFGLQSMNMHPIENNSIPPFNQDLSKHVQMPGGIDPSSNYNWTPNPNIPDKNLPMPPNGWWPTTGAQNQSPKYHMKTFEQYNQSAAPVSQQKFSENFNPKPDGPPMNPIGYDFSKQDPVGGSGGGGGLCQPWNMMQTNHIPYLQMMLANQQNPMTIQTIPNQGLTARQKLLKENKKMFSKKNRELQTDNVENQLPSQPISPPGYSLFNSNWAPNLSNTSSMNTSPTIADVPILGQQSLFSGPGPSPLERLLEQQKQLREPPK